MIEIPASYVILQPRVEEASARLRLAFSLGLAVFVFCLCLGLAGGILQRDLAPLEYGLVAGLAFGGLAFVVVSGVGTMQALERWTGLDINGDGAVGRPQRERIVLVNAGRNPSVEPQDVLRSELTYFINGCKVNTSARRWIPELGEERYNEFRDQLLKGGWARWRNPDAPQQGWELTADPKQIIENLKF